MYLSEIRLPDAILPEILANCMQIGAICNTARKLKFKLKKYFITYYHPLIKAYPTIPFSDQ
jgi:hypothetical protein